MDSMQMPEITLSGIMAMIVFSTIGWYLFQQGRKRAQYSIVGIGVALMGYSYFTHGPLQDWLGGLLLCGAAYYCWDRY